MYLEKLAETDDDEGELAATALGDELDPEWCPDRGKPRATVELYTALIGDDVAANLEGLARARGEATATIPD